jgi:uncharacterized membrane protein YtjA (UPF0391 family)
VVADKRHSACFGSVRAGVEAGSNQRTPKEVFMFSWALIFLVIALISALFGFTGIAGTATNIAWILFVVGIILAIVFAIAGRRPSV